MKKPKVIYAWCCFVDRFVFDGDFETEELAQTHANYHNRNYEGVCIVRGLTKKEFRDMLGFTKRATEDMELAKGIHALTVRTRFSRFRGLRNM